MVAGVDLNDRSQGLSRLQSSRWESYDPCGLAQEQARCVRDSFNVALLAVALLIRSGHALSTEETGVRNGVLNVRFGTD